MLSFKQVESNHRKREPCKWGCSWIIKFLIVWISDIVNMLFFQFEFKMALATCCMQGGKHLNKTWHFTLPSLLSVGKPFPGDLEG